MRSLNYEDVAERASVFIREQVAGAGASGAVFGLSGGIDSAVVAYLAKRALGSDCLALVMPNGDVTPGSETEDGLMIAKNLDMAHHIVDIETASGSISTDGDDRMVLGNLSARIRAMILYYHAQKNGYLVIGTDDKSEYMIGYFTKYGDGASDMLPIASLYKTEVQKLGKFLGVPSSIVKKHPSPHLWAGHDAASEIGMGYDVVDSILEEMESYHDAANIAGRLSIKSELVERVMELHHKSEHKRNLPPIAKLV